MQNLKFVNCTSKIICHYNCCYVGKSANVKEISHTWWMTGKKKNCAVKICSIFTEKNAQRKKNFRNSWYVIYMLIRVRICTSELLKSRVAPWTWWYVTTSLWDDQADKLSSRRCSFPSGSSYKCLESVGYPLTLVLKDISDKEIILAVECYIKF